MAMIEENMSGTWIKSFFASCCGDMLESKLMSEAEPAVDDPEEAKFVGEESDKCVPCEDANSVSNEFILDETERAKYNERPRARVLV